MAKFYHVVFILCFCALSIHGVAQDKDVPVRFATGDFITGNNVSRQLFKKEILQPVLFDGYYYALVQFQVLPGAEEKKRLENAGMSLDGYLPGNAYLAIIKSNFEFVAAKQFMINSINPIPAFYKIDPSVYNYQKQQAKQDIKTFSISFFPTINKVQVESILQKMGLVIVRSKFNFRNTVIVQPDLTRLEAIASLPFVSFISDQSLKDKPINYNDIATHGIASLQSLAGRNLNGRGLIVGVGDNADISTHIDFNGKVISRHPFPYDNHGTHTSGTVAGAGFLNPRNHGMAPKAHIISQWFSDVVVNTPVYFSDFNMVATNNSYYSSAIGCSGNRKYDIMSSYADDQMTNYDEVLHVFAAGNDGSYTCPGFPASFGTVKSGWQCAKNVITVGAMDQANYGIAGFSSRGPTVDGRIKPEIVTNGYATLSTYPNDTYALNYGTSMAAPVITGVTALLQEAYRKTHGGANAKAALLKALMCNTSEDLGNPGPDYTFGFGMLNARKAVEALEATRYFSGSISTSQNSPYDIVVPAGARRLKVLLYWADRPAAAAAASALVNDLDLTVIEPSSNARLPLILNPLSVSGNATEAADHLNNIEQVVIDNPAAGTYHANINGFSIPQGPQTYYLTYQIDLDGITIEYPFGGETLVPGETETIRWTAYGQESNSFNVEYSDNNGGSWNPAGTGTAAANARSLTWTVPSPASNNYLVRVSRNNTGLADQSDFTFSVLGQPLVTASVPCEGYVQLNWPAINSASAYEVFQLMGDSMAIIGNPLSNSFLVEGLSGNSSYRFAVAAKYGSITGRRSLAIKVTPATGVCSLATFEGNFKALSIDAPMTGRQFTSTALSSAEQVKLTIKNLDNGVSSGSYDLSYQVNGGTIVTENDNVNINALATYTHSFSPTAAFALPGIYEVKAWVSKPGDSHAADDTVVTMIKNLGNPLLSLPVTDGFESTTVKEYTTNTIGLEGDDRADFKTSTSRGRARTFVNSGFAWNGNRAITLDQFPYGALSADSLLMTWNLANYNAGNQLRIDFNYKNHGQANNPGNKVWFRGSDNLPWVFAYDLAFNQNELGKWKHGLINVNDILDTMAVPQSISSSFQLKIGQEGNTSANVPDPYVDQDDGYTIDDVSIAEAIGDVSIDAIVSPLKDGCGLAGNYPVSIRLKNYSNVPVNNVTVNYRLNGGTVISENVPVLGANQVLAYTFAVRADLSAYVDYSFDCWITAAGDSYQSNDSVINYTVHNSPVISSFPYLQSFETDNGYWYTKGFNSSWEWGIPSKTIINKAANGTKAWMTGLVGNYNNSELSYLYSPCFNLAPLTQPVLSFSHIFEIEQDYDYAWVEYSTDGKIWRKLGVTGSGTNWYDNNGADNWRLSKTKWHVASIDLPPYAGNMRFRFVIASDAGVTLEGMGIDDIHIFDKAAIYTGPVVSGITQQASGSNWINFYAAGKIVAAINPMGQDLGSTRVDVYPFAGQVRNSNGQYYLDRNIVISPANTPANNVKVRVYFTETESNALLNATGCGTCIKPVDPYELGVTKYNGDNTDENGNVEDDLNGYFQFLFPSATDIIPYDNGYYAEVSINSFGELWLSKASIKPAASNVCPGSGISLSASTTGLAYQWQVNSGSGFVNVINGPNYNGANAAMLQLVALPTSFTGNVYRCVVDGINGNETVLRFTNIWTGNSNTDWLTASNWSCNVVPDQYTDVIIPGGLSNNPVLNANTAVRSVRAYPGVPVLIKAGINLDIKGN